MPGRVAGPGGVRAAAGTNGAEGGVAVAAPAPVSPHALQLLARADGELVAAQMSSQPWERYLHAHLAALRAGAAVLAARGAPGGRGAPRDVWGALDRVAPELAGWSAYFAAGASLRAAAEAGRLDRVGAPRADQAVDVAQDMVDAVRTLLAPGRTAPSRAVRSRAAPAAARAS